MAELGLAAYSRCYELHNMVALPIPRRTLPAAGAIMASPLPDVADL